MLQRWNFASAMVEVRRLSPKHATLESIGHADRGVVPIALGPKQAPLLGRAVHRGESADDPLAVADL
jgi:hypothetical protein